MRVLLISYDNYSYIHEFPLGLAYIASALRNVGHEVEIYNQDVFHYTAPHLTDYLNRCRFDVVGLGFVAGYWQYRKFLEISNSINSSRYRPIYILGGHGPSPEPEYFLKKGSTDVAVIGEGETIIVNLLDALEHKKNLSSVKGIAYVDDGKVTITQRQEPINDLDSVPLPVWDLFPMDYYSLIRYPKMENKDRCFPVITSRGCPFRCSFCYRMMEGLRARSTESVIEEIDILKRDHNINYIAFHDELFMSSPKRIIEMCQALIKAKPNIKWYCDGRLNYAKPKILKLMRKAGCVFINYGIEAMDDRVLSLMNKKLTTKQIVDGIEATLTEGISPGLNIIFGNIGDSERTLQKDVGFLLKYDDHAQLRTIRPVTPYPGCDLYYYAIEKGLLKDVADFYENKHTNSDLLSVNFTDLPDDKFHQLLYNANKALLTNYYNHQLEKMISTAERLYLGNASFRGYRQT